MAGGTAMIADPARHIATVAEILLGQPNATLSTDAEWRFGSHGSLAINITAGTWYDHEHGTGGGVLDLIGCELHCNRGDAMAWLKKHVDGVDELQPRRANGHTAKPKLGRQVAAYDYVSEHGKLLFQVVRYEPKDFRQRRPDPT